MGQCGPHVHFSTTCLDISIAGGITATCGGASVFAVSAGVGGIGQSFLASNMFWGVDSELGQGVPSLIVALGMSSIMGGWDCAWKDFPGISLLGKELHFIFLLPNCILLLVWMLQPDLTTGIWVEVVATVGVGVVGVVVVGVNWAITLTLYHPLVSTVLLLLSFVWGPGAFLIIGLLILG